MSIIVVVTSVVFYKNKKLSYSKTRSVFLPEERLAQTFATLQSIRKKIPNSKIFFLEQGTKDLKSFGIEKYVDRYIYLGKNKCVRMATDSMFKGLGEAIGLIFASKYFPKNFSRFFKISGRYYLNDNFDLASWFEEGFVAKKYKNSISTRLYAFDKKIYKFWRLSLLFSIPILFLNRSIENLMYYFIPKKYFVFIDTLGISGVIAVDKNSIINE